MSDLKCNRCKHIFGEHEIVKVKDGFDHAFGWEEWEEEQCPYCESIDIEEYDFEDEEVDEDEETI